MGIFDKDLFPFPFEEGELERFAEAFKAELERDTKFKGPDRPFPFEEGQLEREAEEMQRACVILDQQADRASENMRNPNATIYIRFTKDLKNNYIQLLNDDDPAIAATKLMYFDISNLTDIFGISFSVTDEGVLVMTKAEGFNSVAKQKQYIIDTDSKVLMRDLYANSVEINHSPLIMYQDEVFINQLKVNGEKLQAIKSSNNKPSKIVTKKLSVNCNHIDNSNGKLKSLEFDLVSKYLNNRNGKIIGHSGKIDTNSLNNNNGIISSVLTKASRLNTDLIEEYSKQRINLNGGPLTIKTVKLNNTNNGLIIAKDKLLIDSKAYNISKALSLFVDKIQTGLLNEGTIASLDDEVTANFVDNAYNLKGGIILAKKEATVSSLGKVFRDPDSIIYGNTTNVSGLALNLGAIKAKRLRLKAYRRVIAPKMAVQKKLDVEVVNGNGNYQDAVCRGEATIQQLGRETLEMHNGQAVKKRHGKAELNNCQFKKLNVAANHLKVDKVTADTVSATVNNVEYKEDSFNVNNLELTFLQQHPINTPLNIKHLTLTGPGSEITAPITTDHLISKIKELHHAKGKIAAKTSVFAADTMITEDEILSEQLTATVEKRFTYNNDLLKANNYNLTMGDVKDLRLPYTVAGNYSAAVTSNNREFVHLLHNMYVGGKFNLAMPGEQFVVGDESNQVEIYAKGEQTVNAANVDVKNGVFLSETAVDLFGADGLVYGRLVPEGQTPSNISSNGPVTLGSDKVVRVNGADIYSRDLFTVNAKNDSFENIAGDIWCMQDTQLNTPLFLHSISYRKIPAGNGNIPNNVPRPSDGWNEHGVEYYYLGSDVVDSAPAQMTVVGELNVTGHTKNIASSLVYGKLGEGTVLGDQENLTEFHQFSVSSFLGHEKPRKRQYFPNQRRSFGGSKQFNASETCHSKEEITVKAKDRSVREGTLVTQAALKCDFHEMQLGTLKNINLNNQVANFNPLLDLSSLQTKPNALHHINPNKENSSSVFCSRIPLDFGLPLTIPAVTLNNKEFNIGNPDQLRKLYNPLQEMQLIVKGLNRQIGHNIVGEGLNPLELYNYLLKNSYTFFDKISRKIYNSSINWDNLAVATQLKDQELQEPILLYRQREFLHENGEKEQVLVPYLFTPKNCFNPSIMAGAGGIWAKVIKLIGDQSSRLTVTGTLHGKDEVFVKAEDSSIIKRQYKELRTVTTVNKSSSTLGGSHTDVSYSTVETKESQPGGALIGDQIVMEIDNSCTTKGAEIIHGSGGFHVKAKTITDTANVDVSLQDVTASGSTMLNSKSVSTQIAAKTVVPTRIISDSSNKGPVTMDAETTHLEGTQFNNSKFIYIATEELLKIIPTVAGEEIAPSVSKKGLALFTSTGYIERGVPVVLDAEEGVYLKSGKKMELHAPCFKTTSITVIAREVLLAAFKLKQELLIRGKGLVNWKNYLTKYMNHVLQENALVPMLHADFIKILATEGSAILESPIIKGLNVEKAICDIEAKIDIIFKAVKLHREQNTIKKGFGLSLNSPLIDAALQDSLNPIINSLPLIANVKGLIDSKCEGEALGYGLLTFYHAYDAYRKLASGDFATYLRDQIFSVGSSLKYEEKKTKEVSVEPVPSFINVSQFLLKAGNAIDLEEIKADVKKFLVMAKQVSFHSATEHFSKQEHSISASIGANVSGSGLTVTAGVENTKNKTEVVKHASSEIKAEEFIVLVDDANFRGAMVEAAHVFMEVAKTLTIETPLNSLRQKSSSQHVSVSYNVATRSFSGSAGVTSDSHEKKWADTQTSIKASHTAHINVGEKTDLIGGCLSVGKEAKPTMSAILNGNNIAFYEQRVPKEFEEYIADLKKLLKPVMYKWPNLSETDEVKYFEPITTSGSDGACSLTALYKITGTNEEGSVARAKAVGQLQNNINNLEIRALIKSEIKGALLSEAELSYLLNYTNFSITSEQLQLIQNFKVSRRKFIDEGENYKIKYFGHEDLPVKINSNIESYGDLFINGALDSCCGITKEEKAKLIELKQQVNIASINLEQLSESKVLDYINNVVAKSGFWLGVSGKSPGVMGAVAKINGINFRVLSKNGMKDSITNTEEIDNICELISDPLAVIHNIHLQATVSDIPGVQRSGWHFELLKENTVLEASAAIKQSNFRIWQVKRDQFGKPILGQLELLKEITGEPTNQNYRNILVKDQEYSLLTTTPGFFSSKEVNSKVVTETEVTRNKGASVSGVPLGGGNNNSASGTKKFDIGPIATAKNLKSTAKQDNNPSILGSWTKNSASDLSGINQDPNNTKGPLEESHTGIYFAYAPRVFSELAKNSSKATSSIEKNTEQNHLDIASVDDRVDIDRAFQEQWSGLSEEQQLKLLSLQYDKEQLKFKLATKLVNHLKNFPEDSNKLDIQVYFNQMQEAIDSMDVEQFKNFERNFTLLDLKETSFNRPKVQLTSMDSIGNGKDSEQNNSSNKEWWQKIKEFKDQYIKTALELNTTERELRKAQLAQYGLALNKAKLAYNKYAKAQCIDKEIMGDYYGVDSLDREIYIQKMQVQLAGDLITIGKQWTLDHLTIAKRRDNFKPSNQVLSNSVNAKLFPEQTSSTKAFSLINLGNDNKNVGLTPYFSMTNKLNTLEINNLTGGSTVQSDYSAGINIMQLNWPNVKLDMNVASCAVEIKSGNLLSKNHDYKGSFKGQCSIFEAALTTKAGLICIPGFDICLKSEINLSARFATVEGKIALEEQSNIDLKITKKGSLKGKANLEIIKRPKPN